MNILTNAKSHFSAKLDGGLLSIDVPEWGEDDKPAIIWFKSSLSLLERDPIYQLMSKGTMEAFAEALMIRALSEDGKRIFKKVEKGALMRQVDPDVIMRVINEITEASQSATLEEAEKN